MAHGGGSVASTLVTNGATLEDCHTNVFVLTELTGLKWCRYTAGHMDANVCTDICEDPIFKAYSNCLKRDLLCVWRRVPLNSPSSSSGHSAFHSSSSPSAATKIDLRLAAEKELWVFWYGEEQPPALKTICASLTRSEEASWDKGVEYETRLLLFKALHNHIERSLLEQDYVRLGKWFVQPLSAEEASHPAKFLLAFNFSFFIHGENNVCVSLTVQRQSPVCRLSRSHLSKRETGITQRVLLAPFCIAACLSRQCHVNLDTDSQAAKVWREWLDFYPLPELDTTENMGYVDTAEKERQDQLRALAPPQMVEVVVGGVRLKYPTAFVLVECDCTSTSAGGSGGAAGGEKPEQPNTSKLADGLATAIESSPVFSGLVLQRAAEDLASGAVPVTTVSGRRPSHSDRATPTGEQPNEDSTCLWGFVDSTDKEPCGCCRSSGNCAAPHKAHSPLTPVLNKAQLKFGYTTNTAASTSAVSGQQINAHRHQKMLERQNRIGKSGPFHRRHLVPRASTTSASGGRGQSSLPPTPLTEAQGTPETDNAPSGRLSTAPGTPLLITAATTAASTSGLRLPSSAASSLLDAHGVVPAQSSPSPSTVTRTAPVSSSLKNSPPQPAALRCTYGKRKPNAFLKPSRRVWKRPRLFSCISNDGERQIYAGTDPGCPPNEMNPVAPSCTSLVIFAQDWCVRKFRKRELANRRPFATPDAPTMPPDIDYFTRSVVPLSTRSPNPAPMSQQFPAHGLLAPTSDAGTSGGSAVAPCSPVPGSGLTTSSTASNKAGGVNLPENIMEDSPTDISNEFLSPPPSHGHDEDAGGQHAPSTARSAVNHNPNVATSLASSNLTTGARSRIDYNMIYPTPPSIEAPAVYALGQFSPEATTVVVSLPAQRSVSPVRNPVHSASNCPPFGESISYGSSYKGPVTCAIATLVSGKPLVCVADSSDPLLSSAVVETDLVAKYLLSDTYSPRKLSIGKSIAISHSSKAMPSLPAWRKSESHKRPILAPRFPMASTAIMRPPSSPVFYSSPVQLQHSAPGSPIAALPPPPPYGLQRCWPSPAAVGSPFSIRAGGPRTPASAGCMYDIQSPVSAGSSLCLRNENSVDGGATIGQTPSSAMSTGEGAPAPEGHSLVLSLLLCDTVANLHRDSSFDSCPLCVCSMGIMGVDAGVYVVVSNAAVAARQTSNCSLQNSLRCNCGFSAVRYRYLSWRAGLFYEDEYEATGVWPSPNDAVFSEQSQRDKYPPSMEFATLVRYKAGADSTLPMFDLAMTSSKGHHDSLSPSYIRPVIELRDLTEMCNLAVEQACMMMDCTKPSRDDLRAVVAAGGAATGGFAGTANRYYMADWGYSKAVREATNAEACYVMRILAPILQESLQKSRGSGSLQATKTPHCTTVEGPLSWRQLHRKCLHRTTNDMSGPEPVPLLLLATEHDWVTVSPFALRSWDRLSLEPYGQQKDVVYVAMVPDSPVIVQKSRLFFRSLSKAYEGLRLGRHCPVTRIMKDGIMPIKKNYAKQLSQASIDSSSIDPYFDQIVDQFPSLGAKLKLYAQICRHYLSPYLVTENVFDRTIFRDIGKESGVVGALSNSGGSSEASSMPPPSLIPGKDSQEQAASDGDGACDNTDADVSPVPHTVVIYFVDAFTFGPAQRDDERLCRLVAESWIRCYLEVLRDLPDAEKARVQVEIIPLEHIMETSLTDAVAGCSQAGYLNQLAFSIFKQPRWLDFNCLSPSVSKPLTGFGTAASHLELIRRKAIQQKEGTRYGSYYQAYCPPFALAPAFDKATLGSSPDPRDDPCRVLFISYCLSENQDWLIASATDHQGCLLEDCIIDLRVNNRRCVTRRPLASSVNGALLDQGPEGSMIWESLRKLWNFVTACLGSATHPWRLVIGRVGRMGHEELKAWAHFLCRTKLRATSRMIRERCGMCATLPAFYDTAAILSACLISTEPDPCLRLFPNSFAHDDRFGQGGKHCPLSTPEDVSCTHIMVFPTSATIHMSQSAIPGSISGGGDDDNDFTDFTGLFDDVVDELLGDGINGEGIIDEPGKSFHHQPVLSEIGDESIQLQPLALGYLVSTAPSGWMPDWFWTNRPSGQSEIPAHLRSSLHIHTSGVQQNDEQLLPTGGGFGSGSRAAYTHPLDSSLTTDVLRYVLETYNSLSWLTFDAQTGDRRTCMPIHIEHLSRLYRAISGFNPASPASTSST